MLDSCFLLNLGRILWSKCSAVFSQTRLQVYMLCLTQVKEIPTAFSVNSSSAPCILDLKFDREVCAWNVLFVIPLKIPSGRAKFISFRQKNQYLVFPLFDRQDLDSNI